MIDGTYFDRFFNPNTIEGRSLVARRNGIPLFPSNFTTLDGRVVHPFSVHNPAAPAGGTTQSGVPVTTSSTPTATPATTSTVPATPVVTERQRAIDAARNLAMQRAELYFRGQGLNPADYMPLVTKEFDAIQQNIMPNDDPRALFADNIASSVLTGELTRQRNEFLNQVGSKFGTGHENTALPSSLLDDTINSILQEQRSDAMQFLDRGKARGIYNDVGYNAGLNSVNTAAQSGRSDLSRLADTVIDNYRSQLDEIGDEAFSGASGWQPGKSFSLDPYITQYSDVVSRAGDNAGGDLRNLLGGTNYFDFASLSNRAGQAQGALNLRDADVATALRERKRLNSRSRGLGSQGAF